MPGPGRQAGEGRGNDRVVRLPELAAQAVDVQVVHACQAPQLLVGLERKAQPRVPFEHAPAVAVAVDRQLSVAAQMLHPGEADPVDAHHHAGAARCEHGIVPAQHLVDGARDVDCVHRHVAQAVRVALQHRHDGPQALVERRIGRIGD